MIVPDASVFLALALPDEDDPIGPATVDAIQAQGGIVPAIFWFEVQNVLVIGERRGRIDPATSQSFLDRLASIGLTIDPVPPPALSAITLARRHGLTAYDAAYLDTALRHRAKLATLDQRLRKAATQEGVSLFTA
jgi:predicted nucleic acid-binding protein